MNTTITTSDYLPSAPAVGVNELVQAFLDGRKSTTFAAYRKSLRDFAAFLKVETLDDAAAYLLSLGHGPANHLVLKYRANLVERDLAASTVNARLAAVRSLVALANTLGIVPWGLRVPGVKAKAYRDTTGPGRDGVKAILGNAASRNDAKGLRDVAIVRLLHDLGLRRAEVVSLDLGDVDEDTQAVWILGKGRSEKERLTLPEPTREALAAWLDVRSDQPGPLFLNCDRAGKGKRLTGRSVHRIVTKYGKDAGIKARPHGLRHAAITSALDKTNGDVRAVQKFSRHADVRTLQAYDDNRTDMAGQVARLVAVDNNA